MEEYEFDDYQDELEEKVQEEEDEDRIEIKRYAFNSFRIEKSIRDIISWVKRDRIIIPEFQRDKVWTYNQAQRLIESILLGLPIPDFFMFRFIDEKDGLEKYMLIDGLQRYTTIKQYIDGIFDSGNKKNMEFVIKNKNSKWNKKGYSDLEENDKDFFMDYSLKLNVFESINSDETTRFHYMTEIFERINTGSTKLSDQEIRNAIYMGDLLKKLKLSSSNEYFTDLIKSDYNKYSVRSKNIELLLRFLTYNHIYNRGDSNLFVNGNTTEKISSSKSKMLCDYMYFSNNNNINYNKDVALLDNTLKLINEKFSSAFYGIKRDETRLSHSISETFSEALVIAIMNDTPILIDENELNEAKYNIWKNKDEKEYECFFAATTDIKNVKRRVLILKKILSGNEVCQD